jgi:hypothetical protein
MLRLYLCAAQQMASSPLPFDFVQLMLRLHLCAVQQMVSSLPFDFDFVQRGRPRSHASIVLVCHTAQHMASSPPLSISCSTDGTLALSVQFLSATEGNHGDARVPRHNVLPRPSRPLLSALA